MTGRRHEANGHKAKLGTSTEEAATVRRTDQREEPRWA